MQSTDSSDQLGGAAPADRQCQFTKSDGYRCRDWALRGQQHCFRHHQYLHSRPENPVEVPLLEDEDSLASLLSQTLRALAWGTIPAANGRAILSGCRIMQNLLTHRLAKARFNAILRRLAVTDPAMLDVVNELLDREPIAETAPGNPAAPETQPAPRTSPSDAPPAPARVPGAPPSPASAPRFPNLRKDWDQALCQAEAEMTKIRFPPRDKTPNPFIIPRVPFTAPTIAELVAAGAAAR